ncbi:DUF7601 domain-containing protein [Faecalimonas sp.]
MKKKLSAILAIVLAFCMSIPVFAAPSTYPTTGEAAGIESTFKIQKKYVKSDGNTLVDKFPAETLKFESTCTEAPMDTEEAPNLEVTDLTVNGIENDITVTVPAYAVPGKYNYEIKELSPSEQNPVSEDSAGVIYDKKPVYIQVVVKYDGEQLKKFVTVTSNGDTIGAEDNADDKTKKGDFKNKYLLDGELIEPGEPEPTPNPGPNPIPNPVPGEPDPITPIPPEGGEEPSATELAKFKIMKQVRGPLASREQKFGVTVTLTSDKPVRSDISYKGAGMGTIKKVGDNSNWTGNDETGYTATVELSIKDDQTVVFSGVPAGVSYKVQEKAAHIGKLTADNLNKPSKGYTVAYYGGGKKVTNPTSSDPGQYGANLFAEGTIGKDTNNNIIIANSKGMNDQDEDMVKPNTGISLDSLPYMMILCLVVLGAGMMVVKSRRRREE